MASSIDEEAGLLGSGSVRSDKPECDGSEQDERRRTLLRAWVGLRHGIWTASAAAFAALLQVLIPMPACALLVQIEHIRALVSANYGQTAALCCCVLLLSFRATTLVSALRRPRWSCGDALAFFVPGAAGTLIGRAENGAGDAVSIDTSDSSRTLQDLYDKLLLQSYQSRPLAMVTSSPSPPPSPPPTRPPTMTADPELPSNYDHSSPFEGASFVRRAVAGVFTRRKLNRPPPWGSSTNRDQPHEQGHVEPVEASEESGKAGVRDAAGAIYGEMTRRDNLRRSVSQLSCHRRPSVVGSARPFSTSTDGRPATQASIHDSVGAAVRARFDEYAALLDGNGCGSVSTATDAGEVSGGRFRSCWSVIFAGIDFELKLLLCATLMGPSLMFRATIGLLFLQRFGGASSTGVAPSATEDASKPVRRPSKVGLPPFDHREPSETAALLLRLVAEEEKDAEELQEATRRFAAVEARQTTMRECRTVLCLAAVSQALSILALNALITLALTSSKPQRESIYTVQSAPEALTSLPTMAVSNAASICALLSAAAIAAASAGGGTHCETRARVPPVILRAKVRRVRKLAAAPAASADARALLLSLVEAVAEGANAADLETGCRALFEARAHHTRTLKMGGYSAPMAMRAGALPCELRAAGFEASELMDSSSSESNLNSTLSASALMAAGYDRDALLAAGFTPVQLKDAGFATGRGEEATKEDTHSRAADDVEVGEHGVPFAGRTTHESVRDPSPIRATSPAADAVTLAPFQPPTKPPISWIEPHSSDDGLDAQSNPESRAVEHAEQRSLYSWEELIAAIVEVKTAGCSAGKLRELGFLVPELKEAGVTLSELHAAGYDAHDLRAAGFEPAKMRAVGVSAAALRDTGCTLSELHAAGYPASALKAIGFTLEEIARRASASQLRHAEYTATELRAVGFSITQLRSAGYDARALIVAGRARRS